MKKQLTPEQIENRTKWVAALRSNQYIQGYGILRTFDEKFCCLGVCADTVKLKNWKWVDSLDEGITVYTLQSEYFGKYINSLSQEFLDSVGLSFSEEEILIGLNDADRASFAEIADLIESQEEITLRHRKLNAIY